MSDRLDLVALRRPVTIVLPGGTEVPVAPYRGPAVALLRQYQTEADPLLRAVQLSELIKLALPTATDADLDDTGPEDWARIVAAGAGKIELVEAALKNVLSGDGPVLPPPPPPMASATTTPSPASSPA